MSDRTPDDAGAPAVLAVDGGNSKTDVALIGLDGRLLAAVRGATTSHQQVGLAAGADRLVGLVREARRVAGRADDGEPAALGVYALAGADTPADTRRLRAELDARGEALETVVVNDSMAPIRAGSDRGWGVAVICGAGVNAAGRAPDGRTARLAALGEISGDRGGGGDLGEAALGAAVRARDGRGSRTLLERLVPAHFDRKRPIDVTHDIEYGRMPQERLRELSPVVFTAAASGDAVARRILDDLADEIVIMAGAMVRRLHLTRLDVEVTLAGGVFRATDPVFDGRIDDGIHAIARRARVHRLAAPPVLGPALMGLDRLAGLTDLARAAAVARTRTELTEAAVIRLG